MSARRRALSLIEVVVAIVILGLAVPPLMFQLSAAIETQTRAQIHADLVQLAAARLAEIRADYANPQRGYAYITSRNYPAEDNPDGRSGYRRVTNVQEVDPADFASEQPGSGIKRIRVTVTGPGDARLIVETFVAEVAAGGSQPQVSPPRRPRHRNPRWGYWWRRWWRHP